MGKTIVDAVLEGVGAILRSPVFWFFVGLGIMAAVATVSPPQQRYVPSRKRIMRELPGGIIEVVEGPVFEQEIFRRS